MSDESTTRRPGPAPRRRRQGAGARAALESAAKPSKRGRAVLALIALAALVLLALVATWVTRSLRRDAGATGGAAAAAPPAAPGPNSAADAGGAALADAGEPAGADGGADGGAAAEVESAAATGPGSLRGTVDVAPGLSFPERWTLVLEPSRTFVGAGGAAWRRVEFEHGERDFEVRGLALGAYDVRPESADMNGTSVPVLIDRHSTSPYVQLQLSAAGLLDGSVRTALDEPIDGLRVVLESTRDRRRSEARTDASGFYRFERVLDGAYTLTLGAPESPIAKPLSISFQAPSLRVPEQVVAALGSLAITVVDDRGLPVQAAGVRGTGTRGGSIEGQTDATGYLEARWLPEGRWRIRAECPGVGSGFAVIELKSGTKPPLEIRLAR